MRYTYRFMPASGISNATLIHAGQCRLIGVYFMGTGASAGRRYLRFYDLDRPPVYTDIPVLNTMMCAPTQEATRPPQNVRTFGLTFQNGLAFRLNQASPETNQSTHASGQTTEYSIVWEKD
jgi:hypothetical protein